MSDSDESVKNVKKPNEKKKKKTGALTQRDIDISLNGYTGRVSIFFDVDGQALNHKIDDECNANTPIVMQWAMIAAGLALANAQERTAQAIAARSLMGIN